jgi:hypothetical protein
MPRVIAQSQGWRDLGGKFKGKTEGIGEELARLEWVEDPHLQSPVHSWSPPLNDGPNAVRDRRLSCEQPIDRFAELSADRSAEMGQLETGSQAVKLHI